MQVVSSDQWKDGQLARYEAELRERFRVALASESTRNAAESHIARALARRELELGAQWSQTPDTTLREAFSEPMLFAGSLVGLLGIGFVLLAIQAARLVFAGTYNPTQEGPFLVGVLALLAAACLAGALRLLRGRPSP